MLHLVFFCVFWGVVLILLAALNNSMFVWNTLGALLILHQLSILSTFGKGCHFRISSIEDETFSVLF